MEKTAEPRKSSQFNTVEFSAHGSTISLRDGRASINERGTQLFRPNATIRGQWR
jgi:hypothetical protein